VLVELRSILHPVQHIQTVAQKTKELVVFQVYLLMMQLYFGLLNRHNSIELYDPTLTVTFAADATNTTSSSSTTTPFDRLCSMTTVLAEDLDK
jgi:hypothetical protein